MLTTEQLHSPVFNRLTGRLMPKLTHPTARSFEIQDWKDWTCPDKVESFLPMKGELDEQAEGLYAGV